MQENVISDKVRIEVPKATTVLVLGILSILLFFAVVGIASIVLSAIGLSMCKDSRRLYRLQSESFTAASYSKLKAGRVCSIIGLCIGIIFFLLLFVPNVIDVFTVTK